MGSTDGDITALELGLGWPEIDRQEIGGRDRVPDRESRESQRTHGGR
jgi:hypothetical protein